MSEKPDLSSLPKADLHRHLEGSIRPATALDLGRATGIFPASLTVDELIARTVIKQPMDLLDVLDRFDVLRRPVVGYEAVARIARECVEDAASDGVRWANVRFSPTTLSRASGLSMNDVFRAVGDGVTAAGDTCRDTRVEILVVISRRRGVEAAWDIARQLESEAAGGVSGVDFASDEIRHRTAEFTSVAEALVELGLPLTVHTGEGVDASAVAEALALPGVRRLGHALSLVDDASLVAETVARGILVEACPTSNLMTRTVPSLAAHPARTLRQAGVRVLFCTDDPALFGIDLAHELEVAQSSLGFSDEDLAQSQQWGREAFFG